MPRALLLPFESYIVRLLSWLILWHKCYAPSCQAEYCTWVSNPRRGLYAFLPIAFFNLSQQGKHDSVKQWVEKCLPYLQTEQGLPQSWTLVPLSKRVSQQPDQDNLPMCTPLCHSGWKPTLPQKGHIKWKVKWKWKLLSCVRLFVTPWALQSMEFSRPEYWSGHPMQGNKNSTGSVGSLMI